MEHADFSFHLHNEAVVMVYRHQTIIFRHRERPRVRNAERFHQSLTRIKQPNLDTVFRRARQQNMHSEAMLAKFTPSPTPEMKVIF